MLIQTCDHLGVIIAPEKTEGPASSLTVLGIEIDTMVMELRLPGEKTERLRTLLLVWHGRRSGQRRDLESVVGMLQHASKVVRPGRIFLRRMYDVLAQTHHFKQHFTIRLNKECRADLEWWRTFIVMWNFTAAVSRHARRARLVRCIRRVGLRGSVAGRVVPDPTGPSTHFFCEYRSKRTVSDRGCRGGVGPTLARLHCVLPFRQRSRSQCD